ncbi:MAG: fumarylacetoacetate hydrolase family protein [Rhodospirillales bacterium]|nr:fumarylacetoacetate hydrolase family protein [Rhodospirillales bacterium]
MKLLRFNLNHEPRSMSRHGVLLDGDRVVDLRKAAARYLADVKGDIQAAEIAALRLPSDMVKLLQIGAPSRELISETLAWVDGLADADSATALDGSKFIAPFSDCSLHAPVRRPGKAIAVGRNYSEHRAEMGNQLPTVVPASWIKATSAIIGPVRKIAKPDFVKQLDYETELAIVIGKTCKNVPESRAYDVIAGYTIMLDITARDIVRIEKREGHQLLGKMFDSFAPQGPWMVTPDEIGDPMNLAIRAHVNGEIRQDGNTSQMIFPIPKLIAYLSQMTLDAGDIILTGTPSGVAMGRKPDPEPFFMQPGDVLETEIEGIGKMRHEIVEETNPERSWQW